eukprot:Partr_v1_DN27219_c0_g1_i1_m38967
MSTSGRSDVEWSVKDCLSWIKVTIAQLAECTDLPQEWQTIKRAYFKQVLLCHPDKGGDAETFRCVNSAFELLRSSFENGDVQSFALEAEQPREKQKRRRRPTTTSGSNASTSAPWQSYSFYEHAAEEAVPAYCVQLARSGRSKCQKCKQTISKGGVRVGSLDDESGAYGRWSHLGCWRVPSRIWMGLPDDDGSTGAEKYERALAGMNEVLLCGFGELSDDERLLVVDHVRVKAFWARPTKAAAASHAASKEASSKGPLLIQPSSSSKKEFDVKAPRNFVDLSVLPLQDDTEKENVNSNSGALVRVSDSVASRFIVPRPGIDGPRDFLKGKTLVLTGLFPEVGGGVGLSLGKSRMTKIIESFGGRVTSAVSGLTDFLVVGQSPGLSKVSKAQSQKRCRLITSEDLVGGIQGKADLLTVEGPVITSYSGGYMNALRLMGAGPSSRPRKLLAGKKKTGGRRKKCAFSDDY